MTADTPDKNLLRELRVRVRKTHIRSPMDDEIHDALSYIMENIEDFQSGAASPRRGFFITGPAGTGKTTGFRHALSKFPELQPKFDQYGELVQSAISVKLPKKCLTRDIVVEILKAMKLPTEGRNEGELTRFLLDQIRERKIKIIHLDELQHTIRSNTTAAFEAAQDLLKQLLDREDWPLHVVCSGMPRIEKLRDDAQVGRRTKVIPHHLMKFPDDEEWIAAIVRAVAVDGCGLELDPELNKDDFRERLCRATTGAWGTMIEFTQSASFRACARGRSVLKVSHFGQEYEASSGSSREENIFIASNFRDIEPRKSLQDMTE
jgi:AAA domain